MNRFLVVGLLLLIVTEVMSVMALFSSDWLVSSYVGTTKLGLSVSCHGLPGRNLFCQFFNTVAMAWRISAVIMFVSILAFTLAIVFLVVSIKRNNSVFETAGKWTTFIGTMLLCVVGVLFPVGFSIPELGGEPYQMPSTFTVGYSYVLFNLSIVISLLALFVANKFFIHSLSSTRL